MNGTSSHGSQDRREFLSSATLAGVISVSMAGCKQATPRPGWELKVTATVGKIRRLDDSSPIDGAAWYLAEADGDGLVFRFPAGTLAKAKYLTADMLLDGKDLAVFNFTLHEGEQGRVFRFTFGGLNQCSFRVRMALELTNQARWLVEREGAFLKPMAGGDRVDADKVDRVVLTVRRKSAVPTRFCMTTLNAVAEEVAKLERPLLPKGPLLDELGQSTLHEWPAKSRSIEEVTKRIRAQFESAPKQSWPDALSRWGGWKAKKLTKGAGFFRTLNDGKRWWLVDPDGYAFWSAGADCVRVDGEARFDGIETALKWMPDPNGEFKDIYNARQSSRLNGKFINYIAANHIRALGQSEWKEKWSQIVLAEMKRLRFNTVGNWSEWQYASKAAFPYVRPMSFRGPQCGFVYRDFPDIYHPDFEKDAADYADQLKDSAKDPAFIGYFLMNEPTWAFSSETPAAGMVYNTESCHTRTALAAFLKQKYQEDAALAAAWKAAATFEKVGKGKWPGILGKEALDDLQAFSAVMVQRYFQALSKACKKVDPNHLNLGMRWQGIPKPWAVPGMKSFDVFSLNCYQNTLPLNQAEKITKTLNVPVMVGEWHFGALDAGLPASGIGHLKNQADRAKAYRVYLEDAAADKYCVGVHWFTLYDQSALGRFDGENYNIGFLDICNRAYEELGNGAIASHERMYEVAAGAVKPFNDAPEYLPKLYL